MAKQRLDVLVAQQGLCDSREQAQRLILAGEVSVKGQVITKPGTKVDDTLPISVKNKPRYVSRGGLKLEGALKAFPVKAEGKVCLDIYLYLIYTVDICLYRILNCNDIDIIRIKFT